MLKIPKKPVVMADNASAVWNYHYEPNQIYPELSNVLSLVPFEGSIAGARKQMFASHIAQKLNIAKPTVRRLQTGAEIKYGRATFSKMLEKQSKILYIIPFYTTIKTGEDSIRESPETLVIYEYFEEVDGQERLTIDCISLSKYSTNHQHYGFLYQNTDFAKDLHRQKELPAGAILQDSPAIDKDGNYKYAIGLNVAFMSMPGVSEDGIVISDEVLPLLAYDVFEKRRVGWGSGKIPLNLYGDDKVYKPFPDIGDVVRPDNLLMAFREYHSNCSPAMFSPAALREVSSYDTLVYAEGGGKVIDLRVHHDISQNVSSPEMCNQQALKYDAASRIYYSEIIKAYDQMTRNLGSNFRASYRFSNLVEKALSIEMERPQPGRNRVEQRFQKIYRGASRDDFEIEFTIHHQQKPKVGGKGTDCYGGKGVIVKVVPAADMPVDAAGNRAHIVMDGGATMSRMNPGRMYEQFYTACSRDLTKEICNFFGLETYPGIYPQKLDPVFKRNVRARIEAAGADVMTLWKRVLRFYEIISDRQHAFYDQFVGINPAKIAEHLISAMEAGLYMYIPPDNDAEPTHALRALRAEFMPTYGPVTYRGNSGQVSTTKNRVLIGEIYFMLLEKTASDWSAVSSGKLQSFGILSQLTNLDKYASPIRQQAIRAWGETETSIGVAYMGAKYMAEIKDRNNNIRTHEELVMNILTTKKPTSISMAVNRTLIPLGDERPVALVNHLGFSNGWEFKYKSYVETRPKPQNGVF